MKFTIYKSIKTSWGDPQSDTLVYSKVNHALATMWSHDQPSKPSSPSDQIHPNTIPPPPPPDHLQHPAVVNLISTSGGVQYIGGISWVHRGDIMSTSGDVQYIRVFNRNWKEFIKLLPRMYHDIPPMYWTSPDVLMIFPRCTHGIPPMYWTSPNILMVSPTFIMISPRCTEHPPMYLTHIIQGDIWVYITNHQSKQYKMLSLHPKNITKARNVAKLNLPRWIWICRSKFYSEFDFAVANLNFQW